MVELSIAHHLLSNRRSLSQHPPTFLCYQNGAPHRLLLSEDVQICRSVSLLSQCEDTIVCASSRNSGGDTGSPNPALKDKICVLHDIMLLAPCGTRLWSSSAAVRLKSPSSMSDAQKAEVMDAAYDPTKGLLGPASQKMRENSTRRKQEGGAFELCLPQLPQRQAAGQQVNQQPRSDSRGPRGRHSVAAAADRNCPSHPRGGKKHST